MRSVYLDNNATTAVAPDVHEAFEPYLMTEYGNPSSLHTRGVIAERALSDARRTVATYLGADEREIVFTSGATESNNLALRGITRANARNGSHIVSSTVEHEAVLDTVMDLTEQGWTASFVAPDGVGRIAPEDVAACVTDETVLVAVMHVNNELGTVNPVEDIARSVKAANADTYVVVDGAQAFGKVPVDVTHIDCYTMSGHKLHAPKGVGACYIAAGTKIKPLQTGGGQEFGMRSGTENVPGIAGLAKAAELAYERLDEHREHMQELRRRFLEGIDTIEGVRINSPADALENTVNVSFPGVPAEVLLHILDERGIYVSTGSACSSNKQRESHVLKAVGLPDDARRSALRFGLSRYTTHEDIAYVVAVLQDVVPELRTTVGTSASI